MKKLLSLSLVLVLVLSLLAGCGTNEPAASNDNSEQPANTEAKYEDGIYFAMEDDFSETSGWKYVATLEVKDGKIVKADWNGVHKDAGPDKDTVSKAGNYGMVAYGGASAPWHEQAEKVEAYLLETQDPTAITYKDDEGHTDDIAGVSIHVIEFFELAKKALDNGPVEKGPYEDGYYHADMGAYDHGYNYFVDMTVLNGNIVAANFDAYPEAGGVYKKAVSANGDYGMFENGGSQSPWYEQAEKAAAYLIETQDPTAITYKDDEGHTDDIAGVSIHVIEHFDLAKKALENGPVAAGEYKDGIYFAQEDKFNDHSGWKYMVTLEVKNGNIVYADWNGAHKDGGTNKKQRSMDGEYGMLENGGAQAPWYEQAHEAEFHLIETQDPTAITYKDDEGHTDDLAGVSIHVIEFFDLAKKALDNGPTGRGQYKDGNYVAEMSEFSNGWKSTVNLTVVNGYIVAADWDGISENGEKTKDEASASGEYGMVENGGAQASWVEQAAKAEAYLLETQDPTAITYKDEAGHTDDIAGVSIYVGEFFDLAKQALEAAK